MAPGAEVGEIAGVGVGGGEVAQQGVVHARGVVVPVEAAEAYPAVADVMAVIGEPGVGDGRVVAVEDERGAARIMGRAAVRVAVRVEQGHYRALAVGQVPVLPALVNVVKADRGVYPQTDLLFVCRDLETAVHP